MVVSVYCSSSVRSKKLDSEMNGTGKEPQPDPSPCQIFERIEDEDHVFERIPSSSSSSDGGDSGRGPNHAAHGGPSSNTSMQPPRAPRPSEELLVTPPGELTACAGMYEIVVDLYPNGQPVWRQVGGDFWLFSGRNGKWFIGGEQARLKRFDCSMGYIRCSAPHKGLTPDRVEQVWQWGDGTRWRDDPHISVIAVATNLGAYPPKQTERKPPAAVPPLRLPPSERRLEHAGSRVSIDDGVEDRPLGVECELFDEPPLCAVCLGDNRGKSVW